MGMGTAEAGMEGMVLVLVLAAVAGMTTLRPQDHGACPMRPSCILRSAVVAPSRAMRVATRTRLVCTIESLQLDSLDL
jgi:hypothetical protein